MTAAPGRVALGRRPPAVLAPWIERLWYVADPAAAGWELKLPAVGTQLLLNLDLDSLSERTPTALHQVATMPGAALATVTGRATVLDRGEQRRLVGVVLRPGASHPLLGVPATELTAALVPLDALWGRSAGSLRERCLGAATPADTLDAVQDVLVGLLADAAGPERVPARAVAALSAGRPVPTVAAEWGVSASTLHRRVRDAYGVSPKRLHRLARMGRAAQTLSASTAGGAAPSLAQLAHDLGFHDQAHFSHDFTELTSLTPGQYQRCRGPNAFHVSYPGA